MGYLHIDNLYKRDEVLQFKRVYALEKIHGTSAHLKWDGNGVTFFSGGEKHERFVELFDETELSVKFLGQFQGAPLPVIIYGEAYGGKQQGMSDTYGPNLKFVAFDVKVGESWLQVEQAHRAVEGLGLEFVEYELIDATLEEVDRCRDKPSTQALRNGISEPRIREGVVLRPPYEVINNRGNRVIAKHKRDEFRETVSPRVNFDPTKASKMEAAEEVARQWVTPMRLEHVIDQLIRDREYKRAEMSDIRELIKLMQDDVKREAEGEVDMTKDVYKAIGTQTVKVFKDYLNGRLEAAHEA